MKRAFLSAIIALTTLIVVTGQDTENKERIYSVPDINGRATLLVQPEIPGDVSLKADGSTLIVKVVVDADGNVVSAKCSLDCPKAAAGPAEVAAMASKFRPLIIGGRAVKYDGTLMYTIAVQRVNWYRFGMALHSTYIFDNLSLGPVAAMLTSEFAEERSKLLQLLTLPTAMASATVMRTAATANVTRRPAATASACAVVMSFVPDANANTAPITAVPVMSPRLRERLSTPEITPRRSDGTSFITKVLLAVWNIA